MKLDQPRDGKARAVAAAVADLRLGRFTALFTAVNRPREFRRCLVPDSRSNAAGLFESVVYRGKHRHAANACALPEAHTRIALPLAGATVTHRIMLGTKVIAITT